MFVVCEWVNADFNFLSLRLLFFTMNSDIENAWIDVLLMCLAPMAKSRHIYCSSRFSSPIGVLFLSQPE